jgi:hypothetical protein
MSSSDGITWSVLGSLPGNFPDQDEIQVVYDGKDGLYAAGYLGQQGSGGPALWSSPDGSQWTSASNQASFQTGPCVETEHVGMSEIGLIGETLFAAGHAVWSSSDGIVWDCVGVPPNVREVIAHDVIVGSGGNDPSTEQLWLSPDGQAWDATIDVPTFLSPAAVADGFVALDENSRREIEHVLYTSTDGNSWTPQQNPFGSVLLWRVASDGSRAVVLEPAIDEGVAGPGNVWVSSTSGSQWTRYRLPVVPQQDATSAAIVGSRLVIAGIDSSTGNTSGAELIWVADLPR